MKNETLYELLQDFTDPCGTVRKGVKKTEHQWMARFALLNPGDCAVKTDWFKNATEPSCSRCGKHITDNWEENMCTGDITMDVSCQSTTALWKKDEAEIKFNHPALVNQDYQKIKLSWGKEKPFKLCWYCQRDFIGTIGDFLKTKV